MPKTELSAKDALKKSQIDDTFPTSDKDVIVPTEKEMQEAASPYLSDDHFELGGKTFQIRISNIKTQKIMAKSLDSVTEFIRKLDIKPLIEKLVEKFDRGNDVTKALSGIAKSEGTAEEKQKKFESEIKKIGESADDTNIFIDMAEFVKEIISYGGISNIVEMILELYTGVIYAVCRSQDDTTTKDWVEENLTFSKADSIFMRQLEKDQIGGRVVDFLSVLTRQVIKK